MITKRKLKKEIEQLKSDLHYVIVKVQENNKIIETILKGMN